jgi:cytochrome c-type biogenesis protein CcmH/NrfG
MTTNERATKSRYSPTQSLVMAAVLLVVGLALGYVIRGSRSGPGNAKPAAPVASMPASAPVPPEQLQRMADEQAKPIVEKLKSDPKDPALLAQLGDLRFDAAQYKEAIRYYERSLELDPKNTRVRADMANAYAYTGNPDRAISEYQTALKYDPKHGLSLLNLGMVQWHDKSDAKSAVETWEKLIKVNPQFAQQVQVEKLIAKAKEHLGMPPPTQGK